VIRGPDGVPIPQNGSIAYGLQVARQDNQLRYEARLREMEAAEVRKQEREREEREKERKQKDQAAQRLGLGLTLEETNEYDFEAYQIS